MFGSKRQCRCSPGNPPKRNTERESRTSTCTFTFRGNSPAMHFDETARNGQTQPETAMPFRARAVSLPERFEEVRQEFRIDAFAGIAHFDSGLRLKRFEFDPNSSAGASKLDCIGQQIPDDL